MLVPEYGSLYAHGERGRPARAGSGSWTAPARCPTIPYWSTAPSTGGILARQINHEEEQRRTLVDFLDGRGTARGGTRS
ncbi:hypothetical protein CRV15_35505 (plasmid) [Streptomyces clavuligerus]|uniref:Uncharacterized protein n=1 Tax=Streptomyces clavuligerus TaxID=1901 RepID=B5GM02_STRCL|nr:hypothetical protein SSCG_00376 [Streptomyces clavuligerus]EFG05005.1 Hypothetical protein SCLAV_p1524 [Streptomyces clavuligerus]QCS10819.1 hypothetical protein CRV15_35505 [Streptomyces clavuligerus]QPJ97144.1 hypothetical protein GE265_28970 [Streptomyces clavuligerus]